MDAQMKREMKIEIARQLANIILNGQTYNASQNTGDAATILPGYPTMTARPMVEPYGLHSLAPDGTLNLSVRVGDHPGSRTIIGHRDASRPALNGGESVLYNAYGQQIRMENGKIRIGSPTSPNPLVLGDILTQALDTILEAIQAHTHEDSIGGMTTPPLNVADFVDVQASPIDDGKIISSLVFTQK